MVEAVAALDVVAALPDHFFHVAVGTADGFGVAEARAAWRDVEPFEIVYRRVNCFRGAPIVEAHTDGVRRLVKRAFPERDVSFLLPHMSIGYFRAGGSSARLREVLEPLREVELGAGLASEVSLCEIPFAKSTFLRPWKVLGTVPLSC